MVTEVNKHLFLYNAPAGSGKTTTIKRMLREFHQEKPHDKYLCITYTNRAADEMKNEYLGDYVYSSTIHAFLSDFIMPYLELPEVIDLYFELFKVQIDERIKNDSGKYTSTIERYQEEYEINEVSTELLRGNVKRIVYAETPFSSYFRGTLSHDDLILFSYSLFQKFPLFGKRLISNYSKIFIDEYQDTDEKVMLLFYDVVNGIDVDLYFFGDSMQQIYGSNNDFLNEKSRLFQKKSLSINYRSSDEIVSCLNRIYNSNDYIQKSHSGKYGFKPQIIITSNIEQNLQTLRLENQNILELHLLNRDKFNTIGSGNLYDALSKMERYNYISKYSVSDVLSTIEDNPDWLIGNLFALEEIKDSFLTSNYGKVIDLYRKNKYFNKNKISMNMHFDKRKVSNFFNELFSKMTDDISIKGLFDYLLEKEILVAVDYSEFLEEYSSVLDCKYVEIKKIYSYIKQPTISTQHGVKGESHDNVVFISNDANTSPYVSISKFYELISMNDIEYDEFAIINREYKKLIAKKADDLLKFKEYVIEFKEKYCNTSYYKVIASDIFDLFISHPTITNQKKLSTILFEKVFSAYKLFYVGCSRARKKLFVLVKKEMLIGFENEFILKMKSMNFDVISQ